MANSETALTAPVQGGALAPISLVSADKIKEYLDHIQHVKTEVMKKGVHYDEYEKLDRLCLLKPGMELLCLLFNMSVRYDVIREQIDPDKKWTYKVPMRNKDGHYMYDETGERRTVDRQATGFYRFQVRADLVIKGTDQVLGSAIGECMSSERGRETAPSNTILKMAEKRAHGAAVLNETFSSSLFTVDIDDDPSLKDGGNSGSRKSGGKKPFKTPAKFAGGQCAICGKRHIQVGDMIIKIDDKQWAAEECWLKQQKGETPEPEKPAEQTAPEPSKEDLAAIQAIHDDHHAEVEAHLDRIASFESEAELRAWYTANRGALDELAALRHSYWAIYPPSIFEDAAKAKSEELKGAAAK